MQLGNSFHDLQQGEDEIPSYVSITPRVGTDDYAAYWAATAPQLSTASAIQQAILSAPSLPSSIGVPVLSTPPTGVTPERSGVTTADIVDLAKLGLTTYGQIQLMNLQADLIKHGKPPLTASQVASVAPQLNFGLTQQTQQMLTYALIGGGALLLLMSVAKGKRR